MSAEKLPTRQADHRVHILGPYYAEVWNQEKHYILTLRLGKKVLTASCIGSYGENQLNELRFVIFRKVLDYLNKELS